MRHLLGFSTALVCLAAPVFAQVTVDMRALDPLNNARPQAEIRPTANRPATPRPRPAPAPVATAPVVTSPLATSPVAPVPQQAAITIPASPAGISIPASPAGISIPAPPAATLPVSAPPAAPVTAAAISGAPAMQASTRLLFPANQAELTADQASVVKQVLAAAPAGNSTSFNVVAFATGAAADPSVARRLSLSRALAVRNALIDGGIPSSRIYVRALGSQAGDGPADRVDLTVLGANAGTVPPAAAPAAAALAR